MRPNKLPERVYLAVVLLALLACLPALFVPLGLSAEGDAVDYRVPLLKWILRHHALPDWRWTFVDDYPLLGDLLMLPFVAVKPELARVVSITAYFAAAAFGAGVGVELSPPAARRPLFLFYFAGLLGLRPLVVPATLVMVDNVATAFALGALYFLLRRSYDRSAALLACALATRYTIWGAAPGALLAYWQLEKPHAGRLVRYAAIAACGALPFLVRNALLNGNPLFPLANGFFGSAPVAAFDGWGRGKGLTALALFPLDLLYTNTFVREIYNTLAEPGSFFTYYLGAASYAQLAACLAALAGAPRSVLLAGRTLASDRRVQATLLFGGAHFFAWWFGSQQLRFLGCGLVLLSLAWLGPIYFRAPHAALPPLVAVLSLGTVARVEQESWRIALGRAESNRNGPLAASAARCFARAQIPAHAVLGLPDRGAFLAYFDYDFVFLPGNNLFFGSVPAADFVYSAFGAAEIPAGYEPWPPEHPCLYRRAASR